VLNQTPTNLDGYEWQPLSDGRGWVAVSVTGPENFSGSFQLPFSANQRGVGMSAGGWQPLARELELLRQNNVETAFFVAYQAGQATPSLANLRAQTNVRHFIVRAAVNGMRPDPQDFISRTVPILREYEAAIGPNYPFMIALHNEPNLTDEGWGGIWADGMGFARWYITVAGAYRAAFPNAKIGFPALSPGGDVARLRMSESSFLQGCRDAIAASDWVGVHYYWTDHMGADINPPIDRWRAWFGALPLVGTEVGPANSTPIRPEAMRIAYQKFAAVGVPAMGWVLDGAGEWKNAAWTTNNLVC
jgi:hypothetical protein